MAGIQCVAKTFVCTVAAAALAHEHTEQSY